MSATRKEFIKKAAMAGIAATGFAGLKAMALADPQADQKNSGLTFLFQGDSITDGNRGRSKDPNHILGHGYVFSIASRAGASFPEKNNQFYNRGISGNTIADLQQRWQTDTLDIKPDVLSILVGVNDTNSVVRQQNVVTAEKYESIYRSLLDTTRAQLPDCLLVLCEPFIMPVGKVKDNWAVWNEDIQKRQEAVRRIATAYNAIFVPLQKVFNDAQSKAAADYWIWDGVHPTFSGHELITREWLKQVSRSLRFLHHIHF